MPLDRIGLVLRRPTAAATVDAIARAEQRGIASVWSTVGGTAPDAVTLFAAAALRTQRITLGTAIVPIYPRHPLALAAQALVLADLAPGRFRLGIGPSHRPTIEGLFGLPFPQPLAYLREYLTVLRRLLWEGQGDYAGTYFTIQGATLPVGTPPPRTPLLISALRPNAFRLAGEIADGAISWMCPVPYLVHTALPALRAGAAVVSRPVPPLVAHVPVAVHEDRAAVRAAARKALGTYGRLPFYARMFADAGYPVDEGGGMPDALFDELVVSGTPEQVAQRLRAIQAQGLDELLLLPVPVADAEAEEQALIATITDTEA
jgi:F420-dependent oxidoreductase-like protein